MKTVVCTASLVALGILASAPVLAAEDAKPSARSAARFEVESHKNLAYYDGKDADPVKHKLDLYLPKGHKGFPVVFFVHGGGWTSGDKRRSQTHRSGGAEEGRKSKGQSSRGEGG